MSYCYHAQEHGCHVFIMVWLWHGSHVFSTRVARKFDAEENTENDRVCEVLFGGVGDSSRKSQKPLHSKLEKLPKTQDNSHISILRPLRSYTSTKVVSGVSSKERAFIYLANQVKKFDISK